MRLLARRWQHGQCADDVQPRDDHTHHDRADACSGSDADGWYRVTSADSARGNQQPATTSAGYATGFGRRVPASARRRDLRPDRSLRGVHSASCPRDSDITRDISHGNFDSSGECKASPTNRLGSSPAISRPANLLNNSQDAAACCKATRQRLLYWISAGNKLLSVLIWHDTMTAPSNAHQIESHNLSKTVARQDV